jgi:hypothetical protein
MGRYHTAPTVIVAMLGTACSVGLEPAVPPRPTAAASAALAPSDRIDRAADEADTYLSQLASAGQRRAKKLNRAAGTGTLVAKLMEIIGSGTAVALGFANEGDAAAISAGTAAGGALLELGINPKAKTEEATKCDNLAKLEVTIKRVTSGWRLFKDDPGFQMRFPAQRDSLYDAVDAARRECTL